MKQDPWLFDQLPVDKGQGKARPYSAGDVFSFVRCALEGYPRSSTPMVF